MQPCEGKWFFSSIRTKGRRPSSGDFEHNPARQARGLGAFKQDSASLGEGKAGLEGLLVQGELAQYVPEGSIFSVQIGDLGAHPSAPTDGEQAGGLARRDLRQTLLQGLYGRTEAFNARPRGVLLVTRQLA